MTAQSKAHTGVLDLPDSELDAHLKTLRICLRQATDIFAQMLLVGKIKAVHRELDKRAALLKSQSNEGG